MFGLKHSPEPTIALGLTKGINALAIILSPTTSFSTCSTTVVLVPVLDWSDLVLVIILRASPCWPNPKSRAKPTCVDVLDTTPDHCVSHAFQTVPMLFVFAAVTESKLPSIFTINAGATSVSNHTSLPGDKVIFPTYS